MSQLYLAFSFPLPQSEQKGRVQSWRGMPYTMDLQKQGRACVQVLALNNERFMVPEVLFQPSDIGLQQGGLAQTITEAVEATHPNLHPLLYSNVVCTGGCATCPGFQQRLYSELRALVPDDYEVRSCTILSPLLRDFRACSACSGFWARLNSKLRVLGSWAAMGYLEYAFSKCMLVQSRVSGLEAMPNVFTLAKAQPCWG